MRIIYILVVVAVVISGFLLLKSFGGDSENTLVLSSAAFRQGGYIPEKYTCMGENINPPLYISGVQTDAKSLALIMEDIDSQGGVWVHWLKWNIPPYTIDIIEGEEPGGIGGSGNIGKITYDGPCPPSGSGNHRYVFRVYALDTTLPLLEEGARKGDLEAAMEGHILQKGELMGVFNR